MFDIIGKVYLKDRLKNTNYFWGDKSDIEGKVIDLLEKNKEGDCLCFTKKGLVDVDKRDIKTIDTKIGIRK